MKKIFLFVFIFFIFQLSSIFAEVISNNANYIDSINNHWLPIKISYYNKICIPFDLNYVGSLDIALLGTISKDIYGIQFSSLYSKADIVYGFQFSSGRNIIMNRLVGVQISGVVSDNNAVFDDHNEVNDIFGIQVSGLYSRLRNFGGFQISGIYSKSNIFYGVGISSFFENKNLYGTAFGLWVKSLGDCKGAQISAFFSICGDYVLTKNNDGLEVLDRGSNVDDGSGSLFGLQIALYSKATNVYGAQVGGLVSDCGKDIKGFQTSFLNMVSNARGAQVGGINIVRNNLNGAQVGAFNEVVNNLNGVQIGFCNEAENVCGLQLGVFNYCRVLKGIQIGFLNHFNNAKMFKIIPFINFAW